MSTQDDRTPETQEVKNESHSEEPKGETPKEDTLDSLQTKQTPDSIPYNRFKEVNDKSKEKDAIIADLTAKLEASSQPATPKAAARGLEELAKEYDLNADVLGKVADEIKAEALAKVQQEIAPITEANKKAEADKVFETMYKQALASNPEYKKVVNKDVIKQLAFNPANSNKTFSQLLESVYGNVVAKGETSQKTMETKNPGKSDAIDTLDFKRAQTDTDYFKQVMADPQLKSQYNEQNLKELSKNM